MERYVWETTRELAALGVRIEVICEAVRGPLPEGVVVHELGMSAQRPRWLSHIRFSNRVARWLRESPRPEFILHSHERLGVHHVTTFHGPPFATVLERGWWRWLSFRVIAHLWLEKRELCAPQVRAVVPNSSMIDKMLRRYYPCVSGRLVRPIPPAVNPGPGRQWRPVPPDGGTIGFVGKEWKRKGLGAVIEIVNLLRRRRPGLKLLIAGPQPDEIRPLLSKCAVKTECRGWTDSAALYPEIDVLLHPARAEPFGMVVAEAMAAAVPVVISDRCGVAPYVTAKHGAVVRLEADPREWATRCAAQLDRTDPPPGYARSWAEVAAEYMTVYEYLRSGR